MDVDRLLNLEKRTGVKESEIEDFLRKTSELERVIQGLQDGTIDPNEAIHIDGIETEEDKLKKQQVEEEKRRKYREKEEQLRQQRKAEERERWWTGVEIFKPPNTTTTSSSSSSSATLLSRYTADYSKWESWVPSDSVSVEEKAELEKAEEDRKNKEFEANNPEFCQNFMKDMGERKKTQAKKAETSEVLRLKGNKAFKVKDYEGALGHYMEALKNTPFDGKLLLNIAQSFIKVKNYPEAEEFLKRTLYLEENNVKALSRKAFVLSELGNFSEALLAVNKALALEPKNEELISQQREIAIMEKEEQSEKQLLTLLEKEEGGDKKSKSTLQGKQTIDELKSLLQILPVSQEPREIVALIQKGEELSAKFLPNLCKALEIIPLVRNSFQTQPLLTIYFRQNNGFLQLIHWIKVIHNLSSFWSSSSLLEEISYEKTLSEFIGLMNPILDEKRLSKHLFLESKVYTDLKDLLLERMTAESLDYQAAIVECFHILVKDEVLLKTKTLLFSDVKFWMSLSQLFGNIIVNNSSPSSISTSTSSSSTSGVINSILRNGFLIFKEFFFSQHENDKNFIKNSLDAGLALNIVYSFGLGLHFLLYCQQSTIKDKIEEKKIIEKNVELIIDNLVGISQYEFMRRNFIDAIPIPSSSSSSSSSPSSPAKEETKGSSNESSSQSPTIISLLIDAIQRYPDYSVNGIAVLMNSSIETAANNANCTADQIKEMNEISRKVKEIICSRKEGVELALSVLSSTVVESNPLLLFTGKQRVFDNDKTLSLVPEIDAIYYTRKVGLLSRLISNPTIAQTILSETPNNKGLKKTSSSSSGRISYGCDYFQQLCHNLWILTRPNHGDNQLTKEKEAQILNAPRWIQDLLNHFIRIFAHLFSGHQKFIFSNESLKKIIVEEEFFGSLLCLLPFPRMDPVEGITDKTVTLVPRYPQASLIIGNVILIFLQFMNFEPHMVRLLFEEILSTPTTSSSAPSSSSEKRFFLIEKAICGMATCQDIRVRKNISILLAKACQIDPKIRERVSFYRGLQMMVELQNEL